MHASLFIFIKFAESIAFSLFIFLSEQKFDRWLINKKPLFRF
jgi:hypothetical protein